jgi:hypothetical protein
MLNINIGNVPNIEKSSSSPDNEMFVREKSSNSGENEVSFSLPT